MIALDTNVLIYCCDTRDPRRQQIALDLVADTADGILPWQVACEFIAATRKLGEQGFTPVEGWKRLAEFLALFPLIMPTPAVLERARELHLQQRWAFWDATLVSACIESGVTRLYSEDLPGRTKIESLEIVSPFA
jgi:predicted nucleic acid-binding protein